MTCPWGPTPLLRVLVECFVFIEVCSGARAPLSAAMAKAGFRVGPRIDLTVDSLWDLTSIRVVEWLLFMIKHKRVCECTTVFRAPTSASRAQYNFGMCAPSSCR